jgi:two-component system chemotaxis response regulator CheY
MNIFEKKVLLCDDSLLIRKKLKGALEEIGFMNVFEAKDGQEAIEFCKDEKPDVVLMDIIMPNKDGLEALQEIKEINKDTIVIMASSVGTQSNLIKAIKMGAANFIQKPMTAEAVLEVIKNATNGLEAK